MHFFFQGKEGRTEGPGRPPGEVGPSPDPACRACLIDPEGNEASFDCSLVKGDGASLASLPFLALGNKTLRTDCSQSPKSFKVFFSGQAFGPWEDFFDKLLYERKRFDSQLRKIFRELLEPKENVISFS